MIKYACKYQRLLGVLSLIIFALPCLVQSQPSDMPGEGPYVFDRAIVDAFEKVLPMLYEQKMTCTKETLHSQLHRRQCKGRLIEPPTTSLSLPQLYRQSNASVMIVGSMKNCGKCSKWHVTTWTGFMVTKTGAMVTAYHAIDHNDYVAIAVSDSVGNFYGIQEVLAADPENDLIVLQLTGDDFKPLALCTELPVGSDVAVIGHPRGRYYTLTEGILSRYLVRKHIELDVHVMRIAATTEIAQGTSGAPLFSKTGAVIGIASNIQSLLVSEPHHDDKFSQMNVNHFIPASHLKTLFVDPNTTSSSK